MFYLEELSYQPVQLGIEPKQGTEELLKKDGQWYAEYKIDGIRMLMLINKNGSFKVLTRNGKDVTEKFKKIFPDYPKLIKRALSVLKNGVVLDGEFYYKNIFQTQSVLFTKNQDSPKAKYEWFVFDIIPLESWKKRNCSLTYIQRRKLLNKILPINGFKKLESFKINSVEDAKRIYTKAIKDGYEGLMLKLADSKYRFKRTSDWVKMKPFYSSEFKCVDIKEGTGKYKGKLGAIVIENKGKRIQVGSGFSDEQRDYFWKHRDAILGKCVEVKYFSKTRDNSLRFPRFVKVRNDKNKC